jgi:hypothetical protein
MTANMSVFNLDMHGMQATRGIHFQQHFDHNMYSNYIISLNPNISTGLIYTTDDNKKSY